MACNCHACFELKAGSWTNGLPEPDWGAIGEPAPWALKSATRPCGPPELARKACDAPECLELKAGTCPHGAQAVAAKLGREARAGFSALDDCLEICNCGCQKQLARLSERIAERPDTFATLGLMGELEDLARAHGGRRLLAWSESTQELLDTLRGLGILGRLCGWAPG